MAQIYEKILKRIIGKKIEIRDNKGYGHNGTLIGVDRLCVVIYDENYRKVEIFPKNFISQISFDCTEEELSYLLGDNSSLDDKVEDDEWYKE